MTSPPPSGLEVAGILLTGGQSRRMGTDKASLLIEGTPAASRVLAVLRRVAPRVIEVGPGVTDAPAVLEDPPGEGPLVAVAAGSRSLRQAGIRAPALVVACDLPLIDERVLWMLARSPGRNSVVPTAHGRPQPLCARWSERDLASAERLVHSGARSMRRLMERPGITFLSEETWPMGMDPRVLVDADSPEDLDRLGLEWRPRPSNPAGP